MEISEGIGWVEWFVGNFSHPGFADQGLGEAVGMVHIVKSKPSFDAEPVVIGRSVAAFYREQLAIAHVESELAADATIGAQAIHSGIGFDGPSAIFLNPGGLHECTSRASLDAFTAGHAGAIPHGVVEIKDDFGLRPAESHANDVVDLNFMTSAGA